MQIFFCAGNSAKNRRSFARGFFWLAIKMLRGGNVSIEVKDHEGSRESILQGGGGVVVLVDNGETISVRDKGGCKSPSSCGGTPTSDTNDCQGGDRYQQLSP